MIYQQYQEYLYQDKLWPMQQVEGIWQWTCPYDGAVVPLDGATLDGIVEISYASPIVCPSCSRHFRLDVGKLTHG